MPVPRTVARKRQKKAPQPAAPQDSGQPATQRLTVWRIIKRGLRTAQDVSDLTMALTIDKRWWRSPGAIHTKDKIHSAITSWRQAGERVTDLSALEAQVRELLRCLATTSKAPAAAQEATPGEAGLAGGKGPGKIDNSG
jgi:hypothetical protein